MIERFFVELRDLNRVYPMAGSSGRHARFEKFYGEQLRLVEAVNFDSLGQEGRIDYLLLRGQVLHEQKKLASDSRQEEDIAPLTPFQPAIIALEEARRRMENLDPQQSAVTLNKIAGAVEDAKAALPKSKIAPAAMNRSALCLVELRKYFRTWFDFYHLYDPKFAAGGSPACRDDSLLAGRAHPDRQSRVRLVRS